MYIFWVGCTDEESSTYQGMLGFAFYLAWYIAGNMDSSVGCFFIPSQTEMSVPIEWDVLIPSFKFSVLQLHWVDFHNPCEPTYPPHYSLPAWHRPFCLPPTPHPSRLRHHLPHLAARFPAQLPGRHLVLRLHADVDRLHHHQPAVGADWSRLLHGSVVRRRGLPEGGPER